MTKRTLPTNTCPKCGKSMGLSHICGLDRNVTLGELRTDDEYINERVALIGERDSMCEVLDGIKGIVAKALKDGA